ncbi:hypothetical protein ABH61_04965 [Bacillus paranthracis]|nr:hypothetical protein [Bacillus paranthracis]
MDALKCEAYVNEFLVTRESQDGGRVMLDGFLVCWVPPCFLLACRETDGALYVIDTKNFILGDTFSRQTLE